MFDNIFNLINKGEYKKAKELILDISEKMIRDNFLEQAFKDSSISLFGFIESMIIWSEDKKWIKLMDEMCKLPFCFNGCEQYSLYCCRKLMEDDRTVENLCSVARNIHIHLIKTDEAILLINEILALNPLSKEYLERLLGYANKLLINHKNKMDEESFENTVYTADYKSTLKYFDGKTVNEMQNTIYELCVQDKDFSAYGFCDYMYRKTKDKTWMQTAVNMLLGPLSNIKGADSCALGIQKCILID